MNILSSLLVCTVALTALTARSQETTATEKPPRAARSVHLRWDAPAGEAFYNEMAVEQSVPGSYFMAVGWNTGYFGIQEIKPDKKVVISSVWDPTKGDNPNNVPDEQRVEVLHQDPDVRIRRFGGEGTGGQCMWDYEWEIGEVCRFLLHATPEGGKTAYAAYFYVPAQKSWKHLATFRTTTNNSPLKGYYSFVEDFRRDTKSVGETRRASFHNGWVKSVGGDWVPLIDAKFSASGSEWESKENIDGGSTDKGFFLATGGDIKMSTQLGGSVKAPTKPGSVPEDLPTLGKKP